MTVNDLLQQNDFKLLVEGEDKTITKVFCCDLLSVAMGKAPEGCAWATVMGNMNTLAVASLADAACIILAENSNLDQPGLAKAKEQHIAVFQTELPIFEAALRIYQMLESES